MGKLHFANDIAQPHSPSYCQYSWEGCNEPHKNLKQIENLRTKASLDDPAILCMCCAKEKFSIDWLYRKVFDCTQDLYLSIFLKVFAKFGFSSNQETSSSLDLRTKSKVPICKAARDNKKPALQPRIFSLDFLM